jgi:hypothetical protein
MRIFNWGIYKRGKSWVFDILRWKKNEIVFVRCFCLRHLRVWNEADLFIEKGGRACGECVKKGRNEWLSKLKDNK